MGHKCAIRSLIYGCGFNGSQIRVAFCTYLWPRSHYFHKKLNSVENLIVKKRLLAVPLLKVRSKNFSLVSHYLLFLGTCFTIFIFPWFEVKLIDKLTDKAWNFKVNILLNAQAMLTVHTKIWYWSYMSQFCKT